VLDSWDAAKAREYRCIHDIPDDLGSAVILQRMVFGNAGGVSGAGVGSREIPRSVNGAVARFSAAGTPAVLVRPDAATEDLAALSRAAGVLTGAGSRTSHAAIVARELGKPCLVGCRELALDLQARTARIGSRSIAEGEMICLDAEAGLVFGGRPALVEERPLEELQEIVAWRGACGELTIASREIPNGVANRPRQPIRSGSSPKLRPDGVITMSDDVVLKGELVGQPAGESHHPSPPSPREERHRT
jgi:phosphoenolpyruvate synthase/pyruvate phosphate dikinase